MAEGSNQGAGAASTRPVSSLLSHFEGLKPKQAVGTETASAGETAAAVRSLRPVPQSVPQRSSFELSRPTSPWSPGDETRSVLPRTPANRDGRSLSPPKQGHRRPMSMLIGSSPQLTPSVQVVSPRSPPRTYFDRSISRSPDRQVDNTPFGKVRELISQHSSRASTPAPCPRRDSADPAESAPTVPSLSGLGIQSSHKAKPPPPVNRAEKPKIPAKPNVLVNQTSTALTAEARSPLVAARVSPFSTPPTSDEDQSPSQSPDLNLATRPNHPPTIHRSATEQATLPLKRASATPQRRDPRTMGLTSSPARPPSEYIDPRSLGFATANPKPQTLEVSVPARANTVSERPTSRDPREFGFGVPRASPRHVSETVRSLPTSMTSTAPKIPSSIMSRDPRQSGFSSFTGTNNTIVEEPKPELPRRTAVKEPPPRPSEGGKHHEHRISTSPSPQTLALRPARSLPPDVSSHKPALSVSDVHFLPPPKRHSQYDIDSSPNRNASEDRETAPLIANQLDLDSDDEETAEAPVLLKTDYPDATQTNRRPPYFHTDLRDIHTRSECRVLDISGQWLCTGGFGVTKIFDMRTGEAILGLNHGETQKVTSVLFKPAADIRQEGKMLWLGMSNGELQEVEVETYQVLASNMSHGNHREIVNILRCQKDIWTIDDDGKLFVWKADESGSPNLKYSHLLHKIQRGHTFSMVIGDKLWYATGREVRVYKPGNESTSTTLAGPFSQHGTGDITSGTVSNEHGGRVYLGHTDGRVTMYSTRDYTCVGNVKVSDYKINSLVFVCDRLWAAYKTGKMYVYDTSSTPWKVKKDWKAHSDPIAGMVFDASSVWTMGRFQIVTAGYDNHVRFWDAMLEEDVVESAMQEKDVQYCNFREVRAAVLTWNAGACIPWDTPTEFIGHAIDVNNPPEVISFGFQEVVDLEDHGLTAKSLLKFAKKKHSTETEQHQGRVYREWRDFLIKALQRETEVRYIEVSTIHMVGLFQCIFVRQDQREKVAQVNAIEVKCGMGGHLGNKGALITRLILDDSSICFVNCHLAAGQSHTSHRNNDVAKILESESLQPESHPISRSSLYVGGGDGSQILDHEICILNGDLNYRIDAIPRDTVIRMIRNNELSKLLERDQIMVSRRRVFGFRLGPFIELPITFAPTYKYDVRTDDYDTSEKKRAPAWCDRILYRGAGRVKQLEYRRHEVKVSDHRPVSGLFQMRIKTVDKGKREVVLKKCYEEFAAVKKRVAEGICVRYLVEYLGVDEGRARSMLAEK